jgi:formyl-CoA transferase
MPELSSDARFTTNPQRVQQRAVLIPLIEARFRTESTAYWQEQLLAAGVPCGPVNDIPTALADPQAQARQMVQVVEHPITGPIPLLGPVAKLSATPAQIRRAPPLLGEQTDQVLGEILGYSAEQIADLRQNKVID